MHGGISGEGVA